MAPTAQTSPQSPAELLAAYDALRAEEPRIFIRDAAKRLGTAEGALVAARCGDTAVRLDGRWNDLLSALPGLGRVLCITRNEWAVHEIKGAFDGIKVKEKSALVINDELDMRYPFADWGFGFAVTDPRDDGDRCSLQIFDSAGTAVHKIYRLPETDEAAWDALVRAHTADDQRAGQALSSVAPPPAEVPDGSIDVDALRTGWREMTNTHQFNRIIGGQGASRVQAFRLAGPEFAEKLEDGAIRRVLEGAKKHDLRLMIFVSSPGATQIWTGVPQNLKESGRWYNILDEGFNLHLLPEGIASTWVVRKPYEGGVATSIEAFDAAGEPLIWLFGKRTAENTESDAWRSFANSLADDSKALA